ncbi:MAG: DUF3179 domain-containing protein, partial [Actinobacteria bacterium]|nr:DUF3179 domain-containing protein [Actinomycetota bacterium]NIU68684.1 DUF3179 domain-containing protein [Actinomycetota bacterium]NIW30528.1 DUF3179 domain-containing protein [Actinomycetota bacterium]NIX22938.1 DUF3179 domain-containing protein [Actinomycetota bacterium]
VGPLVPTRLTVLPSTITTWEQWRATHPDTQVLSRDTGVYPRSTYGSNPYAGYANSSGVGFGVGPVDDRLEPKDLVYGVTVGGASVAYPERTLEPGDAVNDRVGGLPVLVVASPDDGGVRAFSREVGNETLRFEAGEGALVDQHGHRWSYAGVALEGPREGEQLDRLGAHGVYWFAWSRFHPDTGLYGTNETGKG